MKDKTFIIFKPDAIDRRLVGKILSRFEGEKLKISAIKMKKMKRSTTRKFYSHIRKKVGEKIFNETINFMTAMPLVFILLEGKDAVSKVKKIVGTTDPKKAKKGTVRGDLGIDSISRADKEGRSVRNLVHAADENRVEEEIKMFFG